MAPYGRRMTTATTPRPFLTPQQLADRWALDHKTIRKGIEAGEVPCTRVSRRMLIPLAWIEGQERQNDE